jgi:hypothetical protein
MNGNGSKKWVRRLIAAAVIVCALGVGLLLDLRAHGLIWNGLWWLTGEETPAQQLKGFVEYLGNFTRPTPNTAPDVPIDNVDVPPYGVNTFLQQEVEPAKRERQLQMIADAGFKMIRQQFPWEDIEIHGRGDFIDRRNDPKGVDAWAKYDNIVDLAGRYNILIQARLDGPPKWSNAKAGGLGPPDDLRDFVNYAVAVATRYKGKIRYYQIWNEPNANGEWGDQPVDAAAYTNLLCRSYKALKAVDPNLVIISGPLSPTVSLTDRNLSDLIFLQRMYNAGAGACFDVMSAQGYGFYSGPTDRRMRPTTLTYARHIYIRDIMVANGDAHKPIWISEAAWNAQPDDPSIVTSQFGAFGITPPEDAARYMPIAYQRAQEEWPWIGNISYWFFKRAADTEKNQAFYYFRMVEPDFTPLPVYDSMKQYITSQQPVLYPGMHQAESWQIQGESDGPKIIDEAEFGKTSLIHKVAFTVYGTDIKIKWKGAISPEASIDGQHVLLSDANAFEPYEKMQGRIHMLDPWQTVFVHLSNTATFHNIQDFGFPEGDIALDSITVIDRTYENVFPYAAAIGIAIGMTLLVIVRALRERRA